MKKCILLFGILTLVIFNFYSCDFISGNIEFPYRGDWRIVKTEGKNIATIEGTLFTFREDGTLTAKKGLISNNGNFVSLDKGEVTFSYEDTIKIIYTFQKISKKSFKLKKLNADEAFYFEKE